jgi:glycyl-tRNA synthetase
MSDVTLEDIASLCKRRGFIYQGSEIYGGLAGTWDYGPLGLALKRNIMQLWWKTFVEDRDDMYGVDAAILMNQKVWQASGHVDTFTDPLVECGTGGCNMRYRLDHLIKSQETTENIEDYYQLVNKIRDDFLAKPTESTSAGKMASLLAQYARGADPQRLKLREFSETYEQLNFERGASSVELYLEDILDDIYDYSLTPSRTFSDERLAESYERLSADNWSGLAAQLFLNKNIKCKNCGAKYWSKPRAFNMMFKTHVGPVADDNAVSYLRPETAQGIFTNFKNVVDSFYPDVPFGIAQQGKAFRNEISPRDFIFRDRELEQMEIEYFIHPDKWEEAFEMWLQQMHEWCKAIGLPQGSIHELEVPESDRAHYSKRTIDLEFDFPIGKEELYGLAYRTDFDLQNIQKHSGKNMEYRPKDGGEAFVPHVIEPTFGVERTIMAVLSSAYTEDEVNGEKRVYLKLPEHLAPVKYCVSPLLKNKPELVAKAREVYEMLKAKHGAVMWDDNGNIGKRYRRQDEIGTPYCVVIDFQTLEDDAVTVRHRDTTEQTRVEINNLLTSATKIVPEASVLSEEQISNEDAAYKHTNSKGVTYYLNSKNVVLRGGKEQRIFYFSKDHNPQTATALPEEMHIKETNDDGTLILEA